MSRQAPRLPEHPSSDPPSYLQPLENLDGSEYPEERDAMLRKVSAEKPGVDGVVLIKDSKEQ